MIRERPVDKIGIDEYKHFLTTCRIQETTEATELPVVESRVARRAQLRSLDVSPALTGSDGRARKSKYATTVGGGRDFFGRRSMHNASALD